MNKRNLYLLVFLSCVFIGAIFLFYYSPSKFFTDDSHEGISLVRDDQELGVYYNRISYYLEGGVPYQHNRIEYPPLGVFYLTIPAFFTDSFSAYQVALAIQNAIVAVILAFFTLRLLNLLKRRTGLWWLFLLPSFLFFSLNRFDIFPVLLIQISLWLLLTKKINWSFIFLGLAFLSKGYALVLFPIFYIYWLQNDKQNKFKLVANRFIWLVIGPTIAVTVFICLIAGLENGLFPYIFQSTRGFVHGAPFIVYLNALEGMLPAWLFNGSSKIFGILLVILQLLLPLFIYAGYNFFKRYIANAKDVIGWSLLVLLLYVLFSPYYSPQWIIWVLPLVILLFTGWKEVGLVIFYDILNYLQFPVVYNYINPYSKVFDLLVFVRTIVLIVLIIIVIRHLLNNQKAGAFPENSRPEVIA